MPGRDNAVEILRTSLAADFVGAGGPDSVCCRDGVLFMEGEVASLAAKKRALERAARVPGIIGIVDRLRVHPSRRLGDASIVRLLGKALVEEGDFAGYRIQGERPGLPTWTFRAAAAAPGRLDFQVADGVVRLGGEVASLADKRRAGVLAWRVPGCRDVVNAIAVEPPGEDSDEALAVAVRHTLATDPLLQAARIRVAAADGVVFLSGTVPSAAERASAGNDAWLVAGVDQVRNSITVKTG